MNSRAEEARSSADRQHDGRQRQADGERLLSSAKREQRPVDRVERPHAAQFVVLVVSPSVAGGQPRATRQHRRERQREQRCAPPIANA